MSALYDLASLVLVPSGYKSAKVYAQKPMTTDGQLTFTRASTATRVNSSGLIETVASDVPRLDYSGGATCPRLLLEGQRTNLFLQSEAFNTANWTKTNVTLTSGILSPDGTNDAFRAESTGVASMIQAVTMTNGLTYNISLWIKSAGTGKDTLRLVQQTNRFLDVTATNEWVRYNFSFTNTYATGGQNNGLTRDALGNAFDVYIYGFQLEVGSFVSSYIPTTTAAVTRLAETCTKTSINSLIGQTEGTFYAEINASTSQSVIRAIATIVDGSNYTRFRINTINALTLETFVGGSFVSQMTGGVILNGTNKVAFCYKNGEGLSIFLNGTLSTTGPVVTTNPAGSEIRIGTDNFNFSQPFNGTNQVVLFPTRLTNAQLAELTTL